MLAAVKKQVGNLARACHKETVLVIELAHAVQDLVGAGLPVHPLLWDVLHHHHLRRRRLEDVVYHWNMRELAIAIQARQVHPRLVESVHPEVAERLKRRHLSNRGLSLL